LIIGIDLDGTISRVGFYNPSIRLPHWWFVFLVPLILFLSPKKNIVNKLKGVKEKGDNIIIISARPAWSEDLTKIWLRFHKVPFDKIYCVGFGKGTKQRKLAVIREEKIEQFFDDNKYLVEFLSHSSIKATTHL